MRYWQKIVVLLVFTLVQAHIVFPHHHHESLTNKHHHDQDHHDNDDGHEHNLFSLGQIDETFTRSKPQYSLHSKHIVAVSTYPENENISVLIISGNQPEYTPGDEFLLPGNHHPVIPPRAPPFPKFS